MVRRKKTKTTALVLTAICLVISVLTSVFDGFTIESVAISPGCPLSARLAYSFFHASILHAIINCWCLLAIVFIYDVPLCYLAIAYAIAATFPATTFAATVPSGFPLGCTIGLSAVCFALMGMVSFQAKRKAYFHTWVLSLILVGYALPYLCSVCGYTIATPNSILHLYSYVAGLMVGFLNSPVSEYRRACTNGRAQRRVIKGNSPAHAKA